MEDHVKINKNCKKVYPNEKIIYKNMKQNLIVNEILKLWIKSILMTFLMITMKKLFHLKTLDCNYLSFISKFVNGTFISFR